MNDFDENDMSYLTDVEQFSLENLGGYIAKKMKDK